MLKQTNKILVTGGAGFIGSHLIDSLLAKGQHVICLDDFNDYYDPNIKKQNIAQHLTNPNFTLFQCDICNLKQILHIFSEWSPEIVVHLAARAGVRPSLADPFLYTEVNIKGTLNILEAAAQTKVKRFIFGSSSSVYGINSKVPFSENDPLLAPISPYAATKLAGEAFCHSYAHLYKMPTIALRFFTVYGPRQRPDLAIYKFTRCILEGKPITVFGDGSTKRDYTYVGDIIQGILNASAYRPTRYYEVFNLGNSNSILLSDLIKMLEAALEQKAKIEHRPLQAGDVPATWADIEKAERLLGFHPTTTLEEGLKIFYRWLRK
jgi:UDP-glucuronate 4-epimerase